MKVRKLWMVAVFLGLSVLGKQANSAPNFHSNWGSEINPGECPNGTLVINVTHKVVNDVDSAVGGGAWATDNYGRHIQAWEVAPGTFCAVVQYHGNFVTDDGTSPQGTDTIQAGIEGTLQGGYRTTVFNGTLNPSPSYRTRGNIGTFDYECKVETDSGGHETCTGLFSWVGTYFTSTSGFDLDWWGWIYHGGQNGTWVNSIDGNQGDITD